MGHYITAEDYVLEGFGVCGLFRVVLTSSDLLALFLCMNRVDRHQTDTSSVCRSHKQ